MLSAQFQSLKLILNGNGYKKYIIQNYNDNFNVSHPEMSKETVFQVIGNYPSLRCLFSYVGPQTNTESNL